MSIYIILVSYNRPKGLKRAINSILDQTYSNWKCFLMDDGSDFKVEEHCQDERILLFQSCPTIEERLDQPGYIEGINMALDLIVKRKRGLIAYLCDDDWFYPTWLEEANSFLEKNLDKFIIFGKEMELPFENVGNPDSKGGIRFPPFEETQQPGQKVDHCQVIHRTDCIKDGLRWPAEFPSDRFFFDTLAKQWRFFPIDTMAVQKAFHPKALNSSMIWDKRFETKLSGWRE